MVMHISITIILFGICNNLFLCRLSNPPYNTMTWEEVPWNRVSEQLEYIGPFFVYRRMFEMGRRYVPYKKRTRLSGKFSEFS